MKLNLPKEFIWGTATAAHQVEGNNTNSDFWLLENTKNTAFAEPSGITCDQWNRYEEDIDLIKGIVMSSLSEEELQGILILPEVEQIEEYKRKYREILDNQKNKRCFRQTALFYRQTPVRE